MSQPTDQPSGLQARLTILIWNTHNVLLEDDSDWIWLYPILKMTGFPRRAIKEQLDEHFAYLTDRDFSHYIE